MPWAAMRPRSTTAISLREAVRLIQVLRREQDRGPVAAQLVDERPELLARTRVEPRRGLVEQDHRRAADQPCRQIEPAAHAAGVGRRAPRRPARPAPKRSSSSLARARAARRGQAVQPPDHLQVLAPGELLIHGGELAREADAAADRKRRRDDVVAEHARAAGGRWQQRGQDAHERRLAGAVGPEQPEHGARRDREVEAVQGDHVAEAPAQLADFDGGGHAALLRIVMSP